MTLGVGVISASRGRPWEAPVPPGAILGPSWGLLGGMLEAILNLLGLYCAIFEAILVYPYPYWNHIWPIASQRCHQKAYTRQTQYKLFNFFACVKQAASTCPPSPPSEPEKLPLAPSWDSHVALLGAVLGLFWAPLRAPERFESHLDASETHPKRKSEKAIFIERNYVLESVEILARPNSARGILAGALR